MSEQQPKPKRSYRKYKYADGTEGQHILKSAMARDFTLYDVSRLSEEEAFWKLVELRWGSKEIIVCPQCGVINNHYYRKGRHQWRCKDCEEYFSLTTRTPFQDRKLPFSKMLMGMMDFIHCASGVSNHEMARRLDIQVKTAQVFIGKLRESLFRSMPTAPMSGTVQIDGGHFGGRPRQGRLRRRKDREAQAYANERVSNPKKGSKPKSKIDKANELRKKKHRRIVMVLRELYPERGIGAKRTIVASCMSENELAATELAKLYVVPGTRIMTDENAAYNMLDLEYDHDTVQHQIEFSTDTGINDNQAESYFARLRRYVLGVAYRIQSKYMMDIAVEMAWREDVRKTTEGQKLGALINSIFTAGFSRWWRGYWQQFHRAGEILFTHGLTEDAMKVAVSIVPLPGYSLHVVAQFSFPTLDD